MFGARRLHKNDVLDNRIAIDAAAASARLPRVRIAAWAALSLGLLCGALAQPARAAWPGNNGKILFMTGDGCCDRIWSMNPDGSAIHPFFSAAAQYARDIEISPDGKLLVYNDDPVDGNPILVISSTDGSSPTGGVWIDNACGFQCGGDSGATWSPDGSRLLFTRSGPIYNMQAPPGVWTMNRDGTGKLRLVASETATEAHWSPDGTKVSYRDNGQTFWIASNGSSPPTQASREFPISRGLTPLSPDGLKTVYAHCCNSTPDQSEEIFLANADGSQPQQLTFLTASCQDPAWKCGQEPPGSPFHPSQLQWQPIPTPDTLAPQCRFGAPAFHDTQTSVTATVQDSGSGLASVTVAKADDAQVTLPDFDRATPDPVTIQTTNTPGRVGKVVLKLKDMAGNTSRCDVELAPPLGTQVLSPAVDSNPAGLAEAFVAKATATSTATTLSVYVDATSQASGLVAGIYADNGSNHPGALLASAMLAGTPVNGAWNSLTLPAVSLAEGTRYWIAILSPLGTGTLRFRDSCCGSPSGKPTEVSSRANLTTLPANWARGTRFKNDGPLAAWAG